MKKDEQLKIDELKKVIELGEKLKKDVRPDKKKLEILISRQNKNSQNNTSSSINIEKASDNKKNTNSSNIIYSIKSVYTSNNQIIIDFNVDIDKNDIKFFELNQTSLYKDVFDINGYFKDAIPTKLDINGLDKITLGQFKPNVLRIVLSDKKAISSSISINKRQIIITVNNLPTNKIKEPILDKKIEEITPIKEVKNPTNDFIDEKNSIRLITTEDNKIIVKFNKNYSKNNIKFRAFKQNGNYENIFDIDGKYKYIVPLKLNILGIDKIVSTQNGNNLVRIRLTNKVNSKISYSLNQRELIITVNTPTDTAVKTTPQRIINKIIVIDAGHGGDDVGAVGPNKKYEKVINLNVSKYLYTILKQRGYKVFLTRNNDRFIKVMNRTILANEKNADIFISIHTNAVPKEKAHEVAGIETFFLSPARSERAKRVAALENKSDIREMSSSSKDVFLESLNRPRITASHKLAIDVQAGILQSARTKYKDVGDSGVREGPFWVLVGAQMPSILVELGYISHPEESRRLYNKEYQQLLANGIANGVDSYFLKNP
ncbi:MAG: N-acetylmuramoyl-L-alanine amidase [Arcobacter sp.]|uniref:N-acetylmuramoyl-L-alanine amidase family protein n=1 Tax=Arcobacter sp. TaxID=1872629 RepID=UPI003CFFA764